MAIVDESKVPRPSDAVEHHNRLRAYLEEAGPIIKIMSDIMSLQTRRFYLTKELDKSQGIDQIVAESEIVWDSSESREAYERAGELLTLIRERHFKEDR